MDSPPSLGLLGLLLQARGLLELPRHLWYWPRLHRLPRGFGRPVLVLPGYGTTDRSTWLLRANLRHLGYDVQGWGLGRNHGDGVRLLPQVVDQVRKVAEASNQKVHLVGWSMGGYLAREVARDWPHLIRSVITLGTPTVGGPKYTTVATQYREQGVDLEVIEAQMAIRNRRSLKVPITAIYSRTDGIVLWQACIDHDNSHVQHIEVNTSHLGLGLSPAIICHIARNLASPYQI